MISVYWTDLSELTPKIILEAEKVLSDIDKQRYQNITDQLRRLQFLVGRLLIWKKCGQTPVLLKNGKPIVDKGYISLAHSGNIVALAVSEKPVGLDVEEMLHREDYEKIAKRLNLQLSENLHDSFYREFTKFEATYKLGEVAPVLADYRKIGNYMICLVSSVPNNQIVLKSEKIDYL